MDNLFCNYPGCKEVADCIVNIPSKKKDYTSLCNKHYEQLRKKLKINKERIVLGFRLKQSLRKLRNIKNFQFLVNFQGGINGEKHKI